MSIPPIQQPSGIPNWSEILNETGEERSLYFNAMAPPIIQTSNFKVPSVAELRKLFADEMSGYLYSRGLNPTVDILRKKLAAMDGAEDALVFNNGAAATTAAVMALLKAGDHVVCVQKPYTWTRKLFSELLSRYGVTTTYVDGTQFEQMESAILPTTKLIFLESPNSWTYEVQDVRRVAMLAKIKGIYTIIDNTYCSPYWFRPIEWGIDLAMQTATKFISGHSDTLGGVITGSKELIRKIFELEYMTLGSGIQPFNAWLLLRGLRTYTLRLEKSFQSAQVIMNWMEQLPVVQKILFPLRSDFPQYDLVKTQFSGCAGMFSFVWKKGVNLQQIEMFCDALEHFSMAVSWGGHESLILPKAAGIPAEQFNENETEHRMMRLYVGLEDPQWLISDLQQALQKAGLHP